MASRRILVVDDHRSIHQDFQRLLSPPREGAALDALEAALFGEQAPSQAPGFEVDSAYQGEEGIARVRSAVSEGRPYAVAFVDIRMPPGLDGVETTVRLWEEDPDLQVVLCSAYADYSWEEMMRRLGISQRLLILRKPFDATEARQMAHALTEKWELLRRGHRQMEELAHAVAERTRELETTHARLVQAQRLEAVGQMAVGLAHEVNNPLSFVLSNLGFVRSSLEELGPGRLPDEVREACDDAHAGAERIRHIVQSVTLFARTSQEPPAMVDVRIALEEALAMAELDPSLTVVRELDEVPSVWASPHSLGQLFLNLVINANQALRGSGPRPTLRVSTHRTRDGQVGVDVQDNGPGIAPEHLPRIFEPFFTTKRVGEGTGLGLSICHGIASALGGGITVESTPGQGSTFRVHLPTAAEAQQETPPPR
ncbi:ATP-binding protein [Myxococcaceae bacterium GXIMD 01537]